VKTILLLIAMIFVTGCVSIPKNIPSYVWESKNTAAFDGKAGKLSDPLMTDTAFLFKFTNTTQKTSKIIWDETVLIMPDGSAKKTLPFGSKFIDATRSTTPEVVPSGASVSTGVTRADGIYFGSSIQKYARRNKGSPILAFAAGVGGQEWYSEDIVPCASNVAVVMSKCEPSNLDSPITLLLTVENDGKKIEYKVSGTLKKNPAFTAWQTKDAAERASQTNTSGGPSGI
jgi:hypothetical protein